MNDSVGRRSAMKAALGAMVAPMLAGLTGGASSSCADGEAVPTTAPTRDISSPAQVFVTDRTGRRHARLDAALVTAAEPDPRDVVVRIDGTRLLQSILGFGAALTEGACAILSRLDSGALAALLEEFYSPSQCNFGTARLCIGASDYSTELYSYDEGEPDPSLARFSIGHDAKSVLPVLRQARAIRRELYLFGSPWSPPGWMKYGGSMCGGSIRPMYLDAYAHYILKYLQAYAAAGVTVDALTIQNEIDADQAGKMPACAWPNETEAAYVAEHLGPLLAGSDQHPQLWMLDHNYDLAGRVLDQLGHSDYRKYINAIAWHGYAGRPEAMSRVHRSYPDLDMHWTEGGDEYHSGADLLCDWDSWGSNFGTILQNGARSVTTWNMALDESGKPNLGPFHCSGVVTIDSQTRTITRNGIFWALSHYAKAFVRESRLLTCSPTEKSITVVAAKRPDGTIAAIVSNTGGSARVRLEVQAESGTISPTVVQSFPSSVTTVLLKA